MKNITLILLVFFVTPVNAKLYKCAVNGKTAYQSSPCKEGGHEFGLRNDISTEQQEAASAKLKAELEVEAEKNRQAKIAYDNERLIRAEENKAKASYKSAREAARQADAIYQRNWLEAQKKLY
jgi:hypothetical protein